MHSPTARAEASGREQRIGVVTLMFTDLVGSTALKQELGDRLAAERIHRHHQVVREVLARFHEGEEISTAGDSFLIMFNRPSDAVHFALVLQARLRREPGAAGAQLKDRVGIHMGEVIVAITDWAEIS